MSFLPDLAHVLHPNKSPSFHTLNAGREYPLVSVKSKSKSSTSYSAVSELQGRIRRTLATFEVALREVKAEGEDPPSGGEKSKAQRNALSSSKMCLEKLQEYSEQLKDFCQNDFLSDKTKNAIFQKNLVVRTCRTSVFFGAEVASSSREVGSTLWMQSAEQICEKVLLKYSPELGGIVVAVNDITLEKTGYVPVDQPVVSIRAKFEACVHLLLPGSSCIGFPLSSSASGVGMRTFGGSCQVPLKNISEDIALKNGEWSVEGEKVGSKDVKACVFTVAQVTKKGVEALTKEKEEDVKVKGEAADSGLLSFKDMKAFLESIVVRRKKVLKVSKNRVKNLNGCLLGDKEGVWCSLWNDFEVEGALISLVLRKVGVVKEEYSPSKFFNKSKKRKVGESLKERGIQQTSADKAKKNKKVKKAL